MLLVVSKAPDAHPLGGCWQVCDRGAKGCLHLTAVALCGCSGGDQGQSRLLLKAEQLREPSAMHAQAPAEKCVRRSGSDGASDSVLCVHRRAVQGHTR